MNSIVIPPPHDVQQLLVSAVISGFTHTPPFYSLARVYHFLP